MPLKFKRKLKKYPTRKRVIHRRKVHKKNTYTSRVNLPDKRALMAFDYVTASSVSNSSGSGIIPVWIIFRANSLFDPEYTYSGHQPYLYDQMSAMYTTYRVKKCRLTVTGYTNTAGTSGTMIMLYASRYNSSLPNQDPFVLLETNKNKRFMKWKMVSDTQNKFTISLTVNCHELFGITAGEYNDQLYSALVTSDPGTDYECFIHFLAFCPDKVSVVTVDHMVRIKYYSELSNEKQVSQS